MQAVRNFFGRIKGFLNSVVEELQKCAWPTSPELRQSTLVVIVSVVILAAWVSGWDFLLQWLLKLITRAAI